MNPQTRKRRNKLNSQSCTTPWVNSNEFDSVGCSLQHATNLFPPDEHFPHEENQHPITPDNDNNSASSSADEISHDIDTIPKNNSSLDNTAIRYCNLDSQAYMELTHAIRTVEIWRLRSENGRLHHSIETTVSLAEVLLQDAQFHYQQKSYRRIHNNHNNNHHQDSSTPSSPAPSSDILPSQQNYSSSMTSLMSPMSIRLTYASVIIRGVNGVADSMLKNRSLPGSASVSSLCSIVGLPNWIVDLRHDSAHNELPSLMALRLAAKTFLSFLGMKHWDVLRNMRSECRDRAFELLNAYTVEAKKFEVVCFSSKAGVEKETESIKRGEETGNATADDDNDDDEEEESDEEEDNQCLYGAYSIFAEKKKVKPKLTKKKIVQRKQKRRKAANQMYPSEQHIKKFIKIIPMDIGMSVALSYLLWGGICNIIEGQGVLVHDFDKGEGKDNTIDPSPPSDVFQKIKSRYCLLVKCLAVAWPGFTHTLIVHIIDFMLLIEANFDENNKNHHEMETSTKETSEDDDPKMIILKSWLQYLLSNEHHYTLAPHNYDTKLQPNLTTRNMKYCNIKTLSAREQNVLESPAPISIVRMTSIPLNSLCDRCIEEASVTGGILSNEIVPLFEKILGAERVPRFGLGDLKIKRAKLTTSIEPKEEMKNDNNSILDGPISLEEMEAFLLEEADDKSQKIIENKASDGERQAELDSKQVIDPWTLCTSWEPCQIGTLPGYPGV